MDAFRKVLAPLIALVIVAGACGDATVDSDPGADALGSPQATEPSWIQRVYPPPASEAIPTDGIQVEFSPSAAAGDDTHVRLLINGTDVTAYAETRSGLIIYDPQNGPVTLNPGPHEAEVRLVRQPTFGAQHEVVDSYEWAFRYR